MQFWITREIINSVIVEVINELKLKALIRAFVSEQFLLTVEFVKFVHVTIMQLTHYILFIYCDPYNKK